MKRKNILLVVFFLTLFVFQQVQAMENMPSAGKLSEMSAPQANTVLFDTLFVYIYPLDNVGYRDSTKPYLCTWPSSDYGCGDAAPVYTPVGYPYAENGYYYLDTEADYLPNVLPNEINLAQIRPPEPEALKAQAVAARTFATYKSKFFGQYVQRQDGTWVYVIDNSITYQVYIPGSKNLIYDGTTSYQTEIDAAITTTANQFLQYITPCPPPYDGYTCHAIDAEFSSDMIQHTEDGGKPYLKLVQEPISSSMCNLPGVAGNGWGMSQRGAIRWAKGNTCPDGTGEVWPVKWDYKQILVVH